MSGHGRWFDEMVRDEAQDEEYAAEVRAERDELRMPAPLPEPIRETCPNPSCYGGDVILPDPSGFSVKAVCGICCGQGYIVTEAKS